MSDFQKFLLRLKESLGVATDKEAGELLGLASRALAARKIRNSIPDTELYALAAKRPELNLDVPYILTGVPTPLHQRAIVDFSVELIASGSPDDQIVKSSKALLVSNVLAEKNKKKRKKEFDYIVQIMAEMNDAEFFAGLELMRNYSMSDPAAKDAVRRVAALGVAAKKNVT